MVTKRFRFHDAAPTPGEADPLTQILQRLTALEQAVAILVNGDDDGDGNVEALPNQIANSDIAAAAKTRDRRLARDRQTSTSIAALNDQNRKKYGIPPMSRWGN